ncbi:hypothetical protein [Chromatium okenii]|uniref:hypothetical protein n=1 Tax=Chromatium okenii TaxID=61644 RepID=UPI0026EC3145|nr:hypothetical protein [Chromatium okenii]MBV5308180.1 hypothetical protein [Chromatium okenii]
MKKKMYVKPVVVRDHDNSGLPTALAIAAASAVAAAATVALGKAIGISSFFAIKFDTTGQMIGESDA